MNGIVSETTPNRYTLLCRCFVGAAGGFVLCGQILHADFFSRQAAYPFVETGYGVVCSNSPDSATGTAIKTVTVTDDIALTNVYVPTRRVRGG
jgi:hypothetical protein